MFALIRHVGYDLGSGAITDEGACQALALAKKLLETSNKWREIRTSPSTRTRETAIILGEELHLPVEIDGRLSTDGNLVDFLPPNDLQDVALVSHLPVITYLLRAWGKNFNQPEEPPTEVACG